MGIQIFHSHHPICIFSILFNNDDIRNCEFELFRDKIKKRSNEESNDKSTARSPIEFLSIIANMQEIYWTGYWRFGEGQTVITLKQK